MRGSEMFKLPRKAREEIERIAVERGGAVLNKVVFEPYT